MRRKAWEGRNPGGRPPRGQSAAGWRCRRQPGVGRSGAETESGRAADAAENRALDATVSRAYFICKLASPSGERICSSRFALGFGRMSVTSPFSEDFCDFFAACRILQPARRPRRAQPILNGRPCRSPLESGRRIPAKRPFAKAKRPVPRREDSAAKPAPTSACANAAPFLQLRRDWREFIIENQHGGAKWRHM